MARIILVFCLMTTNLFCYSQVNDSILTAKIDAIESQKDHVAFFRMLYRKDQNRRGDKAEIENDLRNLILVSLYVNKYGYPDPDLQPDGDIIPYIWIHNWIDKISFITFPIIERGLLKEAISPEDFRNYHLASLYRSRHIDNRFDNLSNLELLEELEVPRESTIDINEIIMAYEEYQNLKLSLVEPIGIWATKEKTRLLPFGDEFIEDIVESDFIEIRASEKDKLYMREFSKHWKEDIYTPLLKVKNSNNLYVKNIGDICMYKICKNNDLHYTCNNHKAVKVYYPVK